MSPVTVEQLAQWRSHVGRIRTQQDFLDVSVLRRYAVACGSDPQVEKTQPPLAHWAYFLDPVVGSRLGPDGHPLRGEFLPAVTLPRRMFAAGTVEFPEPLELGQEACSTTVITDVQYKSGQSGELVFVELERITTQGRLIKVREQQTIVYRGAGGGQPSVVPAPAPAGANAWSPTPVDLFRFSAVTFNAHRIHYDLPYAREVEGYPDLVVHGPLVAVKLLAFARNSSGRPVRSFAFRLSAPVFVSQPITFAAGAQGGTFVATRCDGVPAATSKVEFA